MKVCSFPLMGRNRRIKAKTIGPPHGLPKRLTFRSGSAFQGMQMLAFDVVKRKRPSVKVKRLVRPLGNRPSVFWPWPPHPARWREGVPGRGVI